MKKSKKFYLLPLLVFLLSCSNQQKSTIANINQVEFAAEMVDFAAYQGNRVFKGTGTDSWDQKIRERGYIIFEDSLYKMWYTGYKGDDTVIKYLGYATSRD